MAENVLETLQRLIQDVIAPDVRELKVRLGGFEKNTDERFDSLEKRTAERFDSVAERFDFLEKQMDLNLKTILSAIGELKAQSELNTLQTPLFMRGWEGWFCLVSI